MLTFSTINKDGKNAVIKLIDGVKKNLPFKNSFNVNGTINGLPYVKNDMWLVQMINIIYFGFHQMKK